MLLGYFSLFFFVSVFAGLWILLDISSLFRNVHGHQERASKAQARHPRGRGQEIKQTGDKRFMEANGNEDSKSEKQR